MFHFFNYTIRRFVPQLHNPLYLQNTQLENRVIFLINIVTIIAEIPIIDAHNIQLTLVLMQMHLLSRQFVVYSIKLVYIRKIRSKHGMNALIKVFNKILIKSEKTFYILLAFLTFFLVLNATIFQSIFLGLFYSLLAFYLVFFSDSQKRITFFSFFFFFSSIFKIPGISTSVYTILITMYVAFKTALLFLDNRRDFIKTLSEIKKILFFFAIMTIQLFLLYLIFRNNGADIRRTISFLIYLLFPIALYYFEKKNISFEKILRVLAIGLIVSSVAALPCFFSEDYGTNLYQYAGLEKILYSFISVNNYNFRIYRFSGLAFDPNYYSYFGLSVIGMLMAMYLTEKDKINIILAAILSVLVLLTLSKMLVVLLAILLVVFLAMLVKTRKSNLTNILFISCMVIFIVLLTLGPSIITIFISRFDEGQSFDFESTLNSLLTGRFDIWKEFVKMLFANPFILFFGSGVGSSFNTIAFEGYGAHNSLLETISTMGIVGLILLIYFFESIYDYCVIKEVGILTHDKKHFSVPVLVLTMLLIPQASLFYLGIVSSYGFAFILFVLFLNLKTLKSFYEQKSMKESITNG